jgi:hypothetical protein
VFSLADSVRFCARDATSSNLQLHSLTMLRPCRCGDRISLFTQRRNFSQLNCISIEGTKAASLLVVSDVGSIKTTYAYGPPMLVHDRLVLDIPLEEQQSPCYGQDLLSCCLSKNLRYLGSTPYLPTYLSNVTEAAPTIDTTPTATTAPTTNTLLPRSIPPHLFDIRQRLQNPLTRLTTTAVVAVRICFRMWLEYNQNWKVTARGLHQRVIFPYRYDENDQDIPPIILVSHTRRCKWLVFDDSSTVFCLNVASARYSWTRRRRQRPKRILYPHLNSGE